MLSSDCNFMPNIHLNFLLNKGPPQNADSHLIVSSVAE